MNLPVAVARLDNGQGLDTDSHGSLVFWLQRHEGGDCFFEVIGLKDNSFICIIYESHKKNTVADSTCIHINRILTDADNLVRFNHVRVQISNAFGKSDLILNGRVACGYPSKEFESDVLTYLAVWGYYTTLDVKFASHWIYLVVWNREKEAQSKMCFRSLWTRYWMHRFL